MESIYVFAIAMLLGIFSGVVPGISVFVTLLIMYPFLSVLDPVSVIMAYVVVVSVSQYFGSVSATLFSIPGTTTSLISIHEGHTLFKNGAGDRAIMFSAIGSFIGSVTALILSLVFVYSLFVMYGALNTYVKSVLLLLAIAIFAFTGKNSFFVNMIMIASGYVLGSIGYNTGTDSTFLTFDQPFMYGGLPTISVMLGLYVIPFIIKNMNNHSGSISFVKLSFGSYASSFKEIVQYKWVLARSSVIGYLSGFVPGMTYHFGSMMSYYLEKMLLERKKRYQQGSIECLLGAETANNAGVFSQILPLLLIGIPITASQALIYDLFVSTGAAMTTEFFQSMIMQVTVAYLLSSAIGLFIAGKYVNWISVITAINFKYIYAMVLCILFAVTFFVGQTFYQPVFYLSVLIFLIPIGLIVNKHDVLPLIFTFLMHDQIYSNFLTLYHLVS